MARTLVPTGLPRSTSCRRSPRPPSTKHRRRAEPTLDSPHDGLHERKDRALAIWNNTEFETTLKNVLAEELGQETGEAYMARYVTARTTLLDDVLQDIRGSEPNLTDHGPGHIEHVLKNVFKLLEGDFQHFNPLEHYILGLSVLFHDVGNLYERRGHNRRIARFYDHVRTADKFAQEKALVVQIAQAHTGEALNGSRNTLGDVPELSQLDGEPIKAREIAAIVRLADELAEGQQRTSEYMRRHGLYALGSIPHHEYSAATDITIDKSNDRIAVTYQLNLDTQAGIEEEITRVKHFLRFACERLVKMDLERRYARFHCVKPLVRFRQISACLVLQVDREFLDSPLHATLSDEVNLDAPREVLYARHTDWDPDEVAKRIRQEVRQRAEDDQD